MNMGLPSCQRPSKNVQADLVAVPWAAIDFSKQLAPETGAEQSSKMSKCQESV
jgi:hypothetical protein